MEFPVVSADIHDFRDMADDEDMAINFYKVGDATELANQLVTILQSPEQQRRMAEQNFSAAMRMTMANVVGNYLRWFELKRAKRAMGSAPSFSNGRSSRRRSVFPRFGATPEDGADNQVPRAFENRQERSLDKDR